ncbi:hypothetical protein A2U01_0008520, partial [Trifolium medium]|nr:hypothetical protein [Trifolium medium]
MDSPHPPRPQSKFIPGGILANAMTQDLMDRDEAPRQLKLHLDRAQSHDRTAKNTSTLEDRLAIYDQFQDLKLKDKDWIFSR